MFYTHTNQIKMLNMLFLIMFYFTTILFLCFFLLFSILTLTTFIGQSIGNPKYPPVKGTIFNQIINFKTLFHYLTKISQTNPTFRLLAPKKSKIYTCDTRNVEHILKTQFHKYSKGKFNHDTIFDLFGDGIFSVDDDKWRHQRKLASVEFSTRVLRDFSCNVFRRNAVKLVRVVLGFSNAGLVFDIQDILMKCTLDSIFKVGFGVELHCLERSSKEANVFMEAFNDSNAFVFKRYLDPFWKLKWVLNFGSEASLKKNIETIDDFVHSLIKTKRNLLSIQKDFSDKEDILSRFLLESEKDPLNMTDKYLRDIILNFMIAGKDTSANTLSWFFYMLCKNPLIQEKVAQEVINVTSSMQESHVNLDEFVTNITDATLDKMHYLHAALTETLRLYPAVPMNGRTAEEHDILPDGYIVNKGETVYYLSYAMGRMPYIWGDDAEEFIPERWLKDGIFQPESSFKFIAFHAGPRICLGKDFAYRQMKIVSMALIRLFRFKLANETNDVTYRTMFTLHIDKGLPLYAVPSMKKKKYHPVAGTVFNQLMNFNRLHHYMTDLARKYKTYRLLNPFRNEVYTAEPCNVEYILKTNFANYGKGLYNYHNLNDLLGDGIFTVDGEKWREQRKISSHEFSTKMLRDFSTLIFRKNAAKVANIVSQAANSNTKLEIQDLFMKSTLDSIFKVAFGTELDSMCGTNEEGKNFANAFDSASASTLYRYVDVFWKIKKFLNIGSEATLRKDTEILNKFVIKLINSRIQQMQNSEDDSVSERSDILSRFLQVKGCDTKYLRDIILNFVIAGKDTTAATLSWFVYVLCKYPEVQEKAAKEVREATNTKTIGSCTEFVSTVTDEAIEKMNYLHATLTETLRLYPALPVDAKICFSDDTLPDGYSVRKGDMVSYQPYAMGRMKFIWGDDAEEFRPERWLDENGIFQPESPFKFTAFQAGPRICLGKEFAYRQMKIFSAVLLGCFRFKLNDEKKNVTYKTMINLHIDGGLEIKALHRD